MNWHFVHFRKVAKNKSKSTKVSGAESQDVDSAPVPLEVKTQLPLRIQDSERTEYVAPVSPVQLAKLVCVHFVPGMVKGL